MASIVDVTWCHQFYHLGRSTLSMESRKSPDVISQYFPMVLTFFSSFLAIWQTSLGQSTLWKPQCHAPQRECLPSQGKPPLQFARHLNLCLYELLLWLAGHTADSMPICLCHIDLWSKKHCNFWFNWTASSTFCLQASNHIQPQGARPLFL